MKKSLLDILACPECKGNLILDAQPICNLDPDDRECPFIGCSRPCHGANGSCEYMEIISGTLTCTKCNEKYPIEDGIPNMLPRKLRTTNV